jgi:hypothetical protein
MIYHIQPYACDLHYGREINKHIDLLPDDAWIVLRDYDTLWLSPNYGVIINNAIASYPDTDLFTVQTNRLGNPKRCYNGIRSKESDIEKHLIIAQEQELKHEHRCIDVADRTVAGMVMIFPKRVWLENPFDDLKIIDQQASFDVRWTRKIKGPIRKIMGLYIWHTYRLGKVVQSTQHLEI